MKINWLYLPLCLAFCCSYSALAQESELSTVPLYDQSLIKKVDNLPFAAENSAWGAIDQPNVVAYSHAWPAIWLATQLKPKDSHRHCTPLKKTDPNFGVYEHCDATLEFVDAKNAKLISYAGKWTGCKGTETYIFHQHSPHQIFTWLAKEENWFLEIRTPKTTTTKRQIQKLLSNEEHPTYIFDFQLNKKKEIVFLSALYASEGFSVNWEIKKNPKGGTTLVISNDCAQDTEE